MNLTHRAKKKKKTTIRNLPHKIVFCTDFYIINNRNYVMLIICTIKGRISTRTAWQKNGLLVFYGAEQE